MEFEDAESGFFIREDIEDSDLPLDQDNIKFTVLKSRQPVSIRSLLADIFMVLWGINLTSESCERIHMKIYKSNIRKTAKKKI